MPKSSKVRQFFIKSWQEGTEINRSNILTATFIAAPIYIFLYFFYTYIVILPYESLTLRIVVALLCSSVYFYKHLPKKIQKNYFPFYWHIMIMSALTFSVTFLLLKNNFHEVYLYWAIFVTFLLALYVPNWLIFIIDLLISVSAAIALYIITTPTSEIINLSPEFNILGYGFILFFSGFIGVIFIYANRHNWNVLRENQEYDKLTSVAGSIAHEIRSPLNAVRLAMANINEVLRSSDLSEKSKFEEIINYKYSVNSAIEQANCIINMVLNDLNKKSITKEDFRYLKPQEVIIDAISNYGYKYESEKQRVKFAANNESFIFKAVPERLTFIIYNLLKNALYYVGDYPDSIITIGTEQRNFKGQNYNIIYVHDTGPGIDADIISQLFGDFFTSGKEDGTGLGLPFCKRNMLAFGGDIICESEIKENSWTKFSLLFPILSKEELKQVKINALESAKKKILVVDDEQVNIMIEKSALEKNLNVACDTANDGAEAIKIFKKNKDYVAIIMDVEMPKVDGFEATATIKKLDPSVPIIGYSSLKTVRDKIIKSGADDFLNKPARKEMLLRTIAKWSNIKYDPLSGKTIQDLKDLLQDKKILFADDETTNRLMLTRYIESFGAMVDQIKNGQDLIDKYISSINTPEDGIEKWKDVTLENSKYDLIITDINMYKVSGDEATIKIREYEKQHGIKEIPIIAFTGDGTIEKLHRFFSAGMNDCFIKGDDNEYLVRIIAFWIKMSENNKKL